MSLSKQRVHLLNAVTNTLNRVSVTILVSFAARGLNSIGEQLFCYTAISSASIVGILPGYLIRKSRLHGETMYGY